jgi:hypothetical protein
LFWIKARSTSDAKAGLQAGRGRVILDFAEIASRKFM